MPVLAFPTEIQSLILPYLPRRDLATLVRVSQTSMPSPSIKLLYVAIELRSRKHIDIFFLPALFSSWASSPPPSTPPREEDTETGSKISISAPPMAGAAQPSFFQVPSRAKCAPHHP